MDQAAFEALMEKAKAIPSKAPQPGTEAPQAAAAPMGAPDSGIDTEALSGAAEAAGVDLEAITEMAPEGVAEGIAGMAQTLGGSTKTINPTAPFAAATGVMQSVFETKDFLFGDTPQDQRSDFRAAVEDTNKALKKDAPLLAGVSSSIGQFAGAMYGLGKFSKAAQALPWFGAALKGGLAAAPKVAVETLKAATAGAIAFDPHEERLSNAIQGTFLENPVNGWLAADPDDSAAEGRLKSAIESIGMDAAIFAALKAGGTIFKHLARGDTGAAEKVADAFQAEMDEAVAKEMADANVGAGPTGAVSDVPPSVADGLGPDGKALAVEPKASLTGAPEVGTPEGGGPRLDATGEVPPAATGSPEAVGRAPVAGDAAPSVVKTPTDAAAAQGQRLGSATPLVKLSDENTEAVLEASRNDVFAVEQFGGWYQAIEGGHTFGRGEGIPYAKLNSPAELDDFMARAVDTVEEQLDKVRGGKVMPDEVVARVTNMMLKHYNDDPATVLAAIKAAGQQSPKMVAMMETAYTISGKMFQDAHALANRIQLGDYTGWGNKEGAQAELRKLLSLATSTYGAGRAITAAGGRTVRRMRLDFAIDPAQIDKLKGMDADELVKMIVDSKADPRAMARIGAAGWFSKGMTGAGYLLVNNLVSGPMTQFINISTNGYMLGVRPLERIIGGAFTGNTKMLKEAASQYAYMGHAFGESFRMAGKAFLRNDSILTPHQTELFNPSQFGDSLVKGMKPFTSTSNLLSNAVTLAIKAPVTAVGLPTRTLGTVDELIKQVAYRSKVMATAQLDAIEAVAKSLPNGTPTEKKAFVKQFMQDRATNAFDAAGVGTDANAVREALITTFQQDLRPGSFGKWMQQGVMQHPGLRLIFPFIKTPTNVMRYGWKMTPGLNLLQTEYREMLSGSLGTEVKAQAIGQMTMGTLFMGTAATMISQGTVTGGGPKDYKVKSEMEATGWREYSFVVENDDGTKTYIPYNRYDPIAMPVGIMTDLMDAYEVVGEDNAEWEAALGSLTYALARQFTNKSYLTGLNQFIEVLGDPSADSANRWLGQQAGNMIPFSAMQRQLNGDAYMREARNMTDKMLATVPGLSETLPARYDWLGQPKVGRRGLWSSMDAEIVDHEVVRLGMEHGAAITSPQPSHNGVDLRDVTMSDGKNAYEEYQKLAGKPNAKSPSLLQQVRRVIESPAYQKAPDGAVDVKGTKLWLLHKPVSKYREVALKMLKRDQKVRDAFGEEAKRIRDHYSELRGEAKKHPLKPIIDVGEAYGIDMEN